MANWASGKRRKQRRPSFEEEIGGFAFICGLKSAEEPPCSSGHYDNHCLGSYCRIARGEEVYRRTIVIHIAGTAIFEDDPRWPGADRADRIIEMYQRRSQRGDLDTDEGQEAADRQACRIACISWPFIRALRDERAARLETLFSRVYERKTPPPVSITRSTWHDDPEDEL